MSHFFLVRFFGAVLARSALMRSSSASTEFSPLIQVGVLFAPLRGQLAAECLGEDRLGEVVDLCLGTHDPLFDLVGEGEELFDSADDFGLFCD